MWSLAGLWLGVEAALAADAPPAALAEPLALVEIAPGVHLHQPAVAVWADGAQADVANLGVVLGDLCTAVIDTGGSPAIGQSLRAAVARLSPLPVCAVISTHAHPDHVFGHAAFRGSGPGGADPRFIAHARHAAALAARERRFLTALQRSIDPRADERALVAPTESVPPGESIEIDLGGRVLRLSAWPTAHTDADLSVLDLKSRTLFLGDLWFVAHLPVLDGSLRGWLGVMDTLARLDIALAVPGHGPPSHAWPGALDAQRAYLSEVLRSTRAALKAKRTLREAVESSTIDVSRWPLADFFHRRNLTAAYAELEWED